MKVKTIETVHERQYPNLFDIWADTSLDLPLAFVHPALSE